MMITYHSYLCSYDDDLPFLSMQGKGLDDPRLEPLYEAAEKHGLVLFIHPHYGVGNDTFGDCGHSLFLAFGKYRSSH